MQICINRESASDLREGVKVLRAGMSWRSFPARLFQSGMMSRSRNASRRFETRINRSLYCRRTVSQETDNN